MRQHYFLEVDRRGAGDSPRYDKAGCSREARHQGCLTRAQLQHGNLHAFLRLSSGGPYAPAETRSAERATRGKPSLGAEGFRTKIGAITVAAAIAVANQANQAAPGVSGHRHCHHHRRHTLRLPYPSCKPGTCRVHNQPSILKRD